MSTCATCRWWIPPDKDFPRGRCTFWSQDKDADDGCDKHWDKNEGES